jgi:hypothetical protein
MVFESFTYYNIFEDVNKPPVDEVVYQRMQETSNVLKQTTSGELYYDTVYSPRLPYTTIRSYDDYVKYNHLITHHKVLNDKKEMNENGIIFFLREMFCCR